MARKEKTLVVFTDDIDGKEYPQEEIETITFALDGKSYEIDLNVEHAKELRGTLSLYISHGRTAARRGPVRASKLDVDPKTIRIWAQSENVEVPSRGRIPRTVVEQFNAAHK